MKQTYLLFGNPLIEKDNLALKLLPKLKKLFPKINFIECDSTENIEKYGKHLNIIDVSPGIDEINTFNLENEKNLEKLNTAKIFSMHDFDLGYNLKLLKKIGLIESAKIICLPMEMNEDKVLGKIKKILDK